MEGEDWERKSKTRSMWPRYADDHPPSSAPSSSIKNSFDPPSVPLNIPTVHWNFTTVQPSTETRSHSQWPELGLWIASSFSLQNTMDPGSGRRKFKTVLMRRWRDSFQDSFYSSFSAFYSFYFPTIQWLLLLQAHFTQRETSSGDCKFMPHGSRLNESQIIQQKGRDEEEILSSLTCSSSPSWPPTFTLS